MSAKFKLVELNPTAEIEYKFHVTSTLGRYEMIICRDLLKTLGLVIDFKNKVITWGKYHTNMKPASISVNDSYLIDNPRGVNKFVGQMARDSYKKFLDAKYERAGIEKTVSEQCTHLS
eukprot:12798528-Ditylum_brightwellii.AAC.1